MDFKLSAITFLSFSIQLLTLPAYSVPKTSLLYLGSFSDRWAYLLPETIKPRGNLKRFQVQTVYKKEQTSRLDGHKFTTALSHWVVNCTEGNIALQQFVGFDSKGRQAGKPTTYDLEFQFPDPNDMREKILDSACDYKK